MKRINLKNRKFLIQKYLYDSKQNKVRYRLDDAYKNINKLWHDQLDLGNARYNYICGDILSSSFKIKNKINLLDIGCGYGTFPNYLNKFKNIRACGVDSSRYAIEVGKKKYDFKNIYYGDINKINLKFSKKFDILTIIGVFWFMLENFDICYQNIKKNIKKNGNIYFQINIPKDNNIFVNKIKNQYELYSFLNKFFKITDFLNYETKIKIKNNLIVNHDSCIIKCKVR